MSDSMERSQERLTRVVMALPGIVGTAIGECDGEPCFKVYAAELTPDVAEQIPARFEDYRVELVRSGEFRALDADSAEEPGA